MTRKTKPQTFGKLPRRLVRILGGLSTFALLSQLEFSKVGAQTSETGPTSTVQVVELKGDAGGPRFDGIGVVDGGGANSILLKDYPEPQRSQILDFVFRPKFGASVSGLLVEIPGDANSTQSSMPSHMHTRNDLNYSRGPTWWFMVEAKKRNPALVLDGTAWSAPGWVGQGPRFPATPGPNTGDAKFWTQDTINYYLKWLEGLRNVYGLEFDAIGCRNEKGYNYDFVEQFRAALDADGFSKVKIHAFDNWPPAWSLNFVKDMATDAKLRNAIDIISAHTVPPTPEMKAQAAQMGKTFWNTEQHDYKKGFDCEISLVQQLNNNFIQNGVTRTTVWYGIAALYPMEPYSEDPSMLLARSPWSGNYQVREVLWGYAHYGQFSEAGWQYLNGACGNLTGGGSFVTLKSPGNDYSVILETKNAKASQQVQFKISGGLSGHELCVWRSNEKEQFIQQSSIAPVNGTFTITLDPNSIYSLSTTTGQQKGSFPDVPADKPFPFPYYETFDEYASPKDYGYLPHYTVDVDEVFEIADRPDGQGKCLRQVVADHPIAWAPEWLPYTVLGDDNWTDYEVSADIWLNPDDTAGVMGRVNDIGTGYGSIPKGYYLKLATDGQCSLVVVRGKIDKKKVTGDAEQQAQILASEDNSVGGEKVLATGQVSGIAANQWHNLQLRFQGATITGLVDGKPVLAANDTLYAHGMAGLMAGNNNKGLSTPYFDNVLIKAVEAPMPEPTRALPGQMPIYKIPQIR